MNSTAKPIKKQKYESLFKRKLLKEYIISQLENSDLMHLYINLEKHLLSQVIINKKTLAKK